MRVVKYIFGQVHELDYARLILPRLVHSTNETVGTQIKKDRPQATEWIQKVLAHHCPDSIRQ